MPGMILNAPAPQSLLGNEAPPDPGIINRLQLALAPMNPQAAQVVFGQQALQQQLQSLSRMPEFQGPGGLAKAYSIVSNPDLQKAYFGNPQEVGKEKAGDAERSIYGQGGHFINGPSSGGGLAELQRMSLENAKARAEAEATGKNLATAKIGLPEAVAKADSAIGDIDKLLTDPAAKDFIGSGWARLNDNLLTSTQIDVNARIEQIKGQAMAIAAHASRGDFGGGIRNLQEAKALTAGAQRINRAGSYSAFEDALKDFRSRIVGIRQRAEIAAGAKPTEVAPPPSTDKAEIRYHDGKAYTRGPNGEAVPVP